MNIYDYIKSPSYAVRNGYNPSYLTRVSTVVNRCTSKKEWLFHLGEMSMDNSVREFAVTALLKFIMTLIVISLPLTCWIIALWMPKGK